MIIGCLLCSDWIESEFRVEDVNGTEGSMSQVAFLESWFDKIHKEGLKRFVTGGTNFSPERYPYDLSKVTKDFLSEFLPSANSTKAESVWFKYIIMTGQPPDMRPHLTKSEFVRMVERVCSTDGEDFIRLVFNAMTEAQSGGEDRLVDFRRLVKENPRFAAAERELHNQDHAFYREFKLLQENRKEQHEQLTYLTQAQRERLHWGFSFEDLCGMVDRSPQIMWPALWVQQYFQRKFFGLSFWYGVIRRTKRLQERQRIEERVARIEESRLRREEKEAAAQELVGAGADGPRANQTAPAASRGTAGGMLKRNLKRKKSKQKQGSSTADDDSSSGPRQGLPELQPEDLESSDRSLRGEALARVTAHVLRAEGNDDDLEKEEEEEENDDVVSAPLQVRAVSPGAGTVSARVMGGESRRTRGGQYAQEGLTTTHPGLGQGATSRVGGTSPQSSLANPRSMLATRSFHIARSHGVTPGNRPLAATRSFHGAPRNARMGAESFAQPSAADSATPRFTRTKAAIAAAASSRGESPSAGSLRRAASFHPGSRRAASGGLAGGSFRDSTEVAGEGPVTLAERRARLIRDRGEPSQVDHPQGEQLPGEQGQGRPPMRPSRGLPKTRSHAVMGRRTRSRVALGPP